MLTTCTRCGKNLKVPDSTRGKKARCPVCKTVFVAEEAVEEVPVLDEPEPELPEVDVEEADEEEPRFSFRASNVQVDTADDPETWRLNAVAALRSAGRTLLLGLLLALLAVGLGFTLQVSLRWHQPGADFIELVLGVCVGLAFFAVLFLFSGIAARQLSTAGSRGLIITGIVTTMLTAFALLVRLYPAVSLVLQFNDNPDRVMRQIMGHNHAGRISDVYVHFGGIMLVTALACLTNFIAAGLMIRALGQDDVKRWYNHQKRIVNRHR